MAFFFVDDETSFAAEEAKEKDIKPLQGFVAWLRGFTFRP